MPSAACVLQAIVGPRRLLDVDHAEPALARDRQAGVVAVVRDLDAEPARAASIRLVPAGTSTSLPSIGQLGHGYFGISASNSARNFSM